MNQTQLLASVSPWSRYIEFLVRDRTESGGFAYGLSVVMKTVTEADQGIYIEPTFKLSRTAAQELMDNLWQCGLRPSEGTGSAGQLAATQKHLEDMREIAFKYIRGE